MSKTFSRKDFLSYTAAAGAVAAMGSVAPTLTSCSSAPKEAGPTALRSLDGEYIPILNDKAVEGKALKVGLIGCGGRGNGAIDCLMTSADGVTITAICDVFQDRVDGTVAKLKKDYNTTVENVFVGFDSYKQVIDSGVDAVMICTPPVFRPEQFKYATEKGKHSFLEKPLAVDAVGCRSVMATSKQADAKKLSVITGTQRHHQRPYIESFKKVVGEGLIGEITGGTVYWNQSMLWYKKREQGWSNMEWMIRDWVNWTWLSGDHITEQHMHNIDVFMWFSGQKPVSAVGFGSQQRRVTGDQYDNFSTDFVMENGVHMHSMCRQIDGCANNVSEFIQGTKGSWSSNGEFVIKDLAGNVIWKYDQAAEEAQYKQTNPYVLELGEWVTQIRTGNTVNQSGETGESTLASIMARESAYTGKMVTRDEMMASNLDLMPKERSMTNIDMSEYVVRVPGTKQG